MPITPKDAVDAVRREDLSPVRHSNMRVSCVGRTRYEYVVAVDVATGPSLVGPPVYLVNMRTSLVRTVASGAVPSLDVEEWFMPPADEYRTH